MIRTASLVPSDPPKRFSSRTIKVTVAVSLLIATWFLLPLWCGRDADAWYRSDPAIQKRLGHGVGKWVMQNLKREQFNKGSDQFNGEWLLMTYMLAGLGFGQTAESHPEWRTEHGAYLRRCADRVIDPMLRQFDTESWDEDALQSLSSDNGHAGYLGYANVVLSYDRLLDPKSPHAPVNDAITAALIRRLESSPTLLLQTYPGETYPVDNCVAVASIALHGRATGKDYTPLLQRWSAAFRERFVDKQTGMLYQKVDSVSGTPQDKARASGTLFAAYFLRLVDPALSRDLYRSIQKSQVRSLNQFRAVREYPVGVAGGMGDVDSGPVLFGLSSSGTAFVLASSRMNQDREVFTGTLRTLYLCGFPSGSRDELHFGIAGPLGDALLFALLTAPPFESP